MSSQVVGIFAALILTSTFAQAMDLTDGKQEKSDSLVPRKYGSGSAGGIDVADFGSASQFRVKLQTELGPNEYVQVEGVMRYLGDKVDGLSDFHQYLKSCIERYQYGIKFTEEAEISVTDEDKIKLVNFGKFALDNLFANNFSDTTVSNEFKLFKEHPSAKGLDRFTFSNNSIIYGLMYFFNQNETPVQIAHNRRSYNDYKFTFLPCSQKVGGTAMEFEFNENDIGFGNNVRISKDSNDTAFKYLSSGMNLYDASYKLTFYKIAENRYRLMVKLAASNSSYYSKLEDQNIAHMIVEIK